MQWDAPAARAPEPDTHALPAPAISCSRAISANASVPMAPLRKPGKGVGGGGVVERERAAAAETRGREGAGVPGGVVKK
ncbi:hypothetical protein [Streptomyces sp. NPDC090112]|uniref:hypothetical protein n=1 Tax=Streptomyces sp. NPDC090112 TaxID=3365949 RepID=UPI00381F4805